MFEKWFDGIAYLMSDDLVSYHSFFSTILAEIAFLWCFGIDNALTFTLLLVVAMVNVLLIAFLKGSSIAYKDIGSIILSGTYVAIFMSLVIIGCFTNVRITLWIFTIPFVWTAFTMWIRGYQNGLFGPGFPKWVYTISKIIQTPIVLMTTQMLVLFAPIAVGAYFAANINMALWLKIILPVVAALMSPVWAYIEDSWATQNIFELAYEMQ